MLDKLLKLKSNKEHPMGNLEKQAKASVLEELLSQANSSLSSGLKKVTVAAKDKEGLKEGLKKAEELLEAKEESSEDEEEYADKEYMKEDDEYGEYAGMSPEDLDAKIEMLMKLKEKMA